MLAFYREPEQRRLSIFTPYPHKYGYYLNINHPLIAKKFIAWNKLHDITKWNHRNGDRETFENEFIKTKYFQKCVEIERKHNGEQFFTPKIREVLSTSPEV